MVHWLARGQEVASSIPAATNLFSAFLKKLGVCTLILRMEWNKITYTVISIEYLPNVERSSNINFKTVFEFSTPTKQSWKICKRSQHFLFSFLDWLTQPQIKESISGITPWRERERKKEQEKRYRKRKSRRKREKKIGNKRYRKREWEEKRESHSYHKVSKTLAL